MLARRTWTVKLTLALATPLLLALPATARAAEPPAGDTPGVHIVRPGDTLERLAEQYLGASRRWPEIARLNPDVHDPKRLRPGSRLRIFIAQSSAPPAAQIETLSRQVDERPSPIPWDRAQQGDLLIEEDGVRTAAKSSAAMRFTDGTRLLVTEDSLVFLRRSGDRLRGTARKSVEIMEGQADLSAEPATRPAGRSPAPPADIEVVLGKTRATSRPSSAGVLKTRARRPGDGGAKVMVYGGSGEVEAAGAKVAVAEGMGTSVAKEGPPGPPEKLLPAPRLLSPPANAELAFSNPVFSWQPVPEAAAYVVELCRDAGCGELLDRAVRPVDPGTPSDNSGEWHPEALPAGTFYWRITARSRSGLDGYPASPSRLTLLSDRPDREPPTAKLNLSGPRIDVAGRLFTAATGLTFEVAADDAGCGLRASSATVDGRPVQPGSTAPWPAGEHHAGGYAVDRCGNRLEVPPLAFTVDTEPPSVRAEVADRSILEREGEPKVGRASSRRSGEPTQTGLYWSSDGRRWLPLWRAAGTASGQPAVYGGDEIASDGPKVFLLARGVKLAIDGKTVAPGEGQLLVLKVEDTGAGVGRLRFHAEAGTGGGAPVLQLEAIDLVGNSRRLSWPLVLP